MLRPVTSAEDLAPHKRGSCRSCGSRILWTRTIVKGQLTGTNAPIDPEPLLDGSGNVVLYVRAEDGLLVSQVVDPHRAGLGGAAMFTSHFATCPDAAKHRKPKGGQS